MIYIGDIYRANPECEFKWPVESRSTQMLEDISETAHDRSPTVPFQWNIQHHAALTHD